MSVEFVEPEPATTPAVLLESAGPSSAGTTAGPAARGTSVRPSSVSALPGRLLAAAAVVAGGLAVAGVRLTLYAVVRTASIVDFDGTTTLTSRIPVDAFGHATPVAYGSSRGLALSDFTVQVSTPDGISYGPWWIGLGIALVVAAVWCGLRPRSAAPATVVAALGALLLGSVGAAWLAARTVASTSVPQIQFAASPALGLWLITAAGGLALLAALLRVAAPHVHLPRHRRRAGVHETAVEIG